VLVDVTVVIPTFNRADDLPLTLQAIADQSVRPRSIIVVDDGSTDATEEVAVEWAARLVRAGIPLIYEKNDRLGPASARNVGWRAAASEHIAFIDSDVTLEGQWIESTLSALAVSPWLGAVGGQVLYAHRPELVNCFGGEMSAIGLAWDAEEGAPAVTCDRPRQVLWANTSALMVRRQALQETGGFDETLFYYYEDSDLGWRLNLAGWQVEVVPEALAFHRVGEDIGPAAPAIVFHASKNRLRSLLVNMGTRRLLLYAPAYLAYALADMVLRRPRGTKASALWWNVRHLSATVARRRRVQQSRRVTDVDIAHLVSSRWFPDRRLSGLRRRPVDQVKAMPRPIHDDRV
jgi:GT2 family glycosyltransferase